MEHTTRLAELERALAAATSDEERRKLRDEIKQLATSARQVETR